jgi:hypothetical protein
MRALRGLTVLGLALVMMGRTPGAWACSCIGAPSNARSFESADVVFIGTVVARADPNTGTTQSAADPITWTFRVQSVQKGAASPTQTVLSARGGATCGVLFTVGRRYQVFAERSGSHVNAFLCGGTTVLAAGATGFRPQLAPTGPPDDSRGVHLLFLGVSLALGGLLLRRFSRAVGRSPQRGTSFR